MSLALLLSDHHQLLLGGGVHGRGHPPHHRRIRVFPEHQERHARRIAVCRNGKRHVPGRSQFGTTVVGRQGISQALRGRVQPVRSRSVDGGIARHRERLLGGGAQGVVHDRGQLFGAGGGRWLVHLHGHQRWGSALHLFFSVLYNTTSFEEQANCGHHQSLLH